MSEAEFLEHIRSHQGLIYKLVAIYSYNEEDKKDLYQEVMYQAWKGWPNYRGQSKISTWLYKVCLNTIFTQKRKKNVVQYSDKLDQMTNANVAPVAEQREDSAKLQTAIKMLSETDRAVIALHLDGYGNDEIAELVGITANNVSVKLYRIKQQLLTLLKKL